MSETTPAADAPFDKRAMLTGLLVTVILDIGVSIAAFQIARTNGVDASTAYLISGIGPLLGLMWQRIKARTVSVASLVILLFVLLSAASVLIGGGDWRILIVKDAVVTAGFGVVCLLSMLLPRPLMFHFGARFATDGTPEGLARWDNLWQYEGFRRSQYATTVLWGCGFLVEAGIRCAVAYTVSDVDVAQPVAQVLPFAVIAVLITMTIRMAKRARAQGRAAAAARAAKAAEAAA